ncbi:RNA-binding transcriptional accessory protein [Lacihabitans sp. LS3-19]|uniref:Tex family protein n=1 Tax=Lacihabitans sp. LS3-19 TaxID=2487335 RepID=UPI0020CE8155|nr:Tex family protein [Lacihabitans sp. LS3-19]MCP9768163.1 RNA-binding transcriptional accessory protein [Lacihabitans sp. LS3-19]
MTAVQIQYISENLKLRASQIKNTIKLLEDGATVPFIARYRKEVTENLDEVEILDIKKLFEKLIEADKRREAILKSIEEQGKLTPELILKLKNALFTNELEDIYLPYKQKKKTRATVAIENGLEPLAKVIFSQKERNIEALAGKYINEKVKSVAEALSGARDIMAEWINEDIIARNKIRLIFEKSGILTSKLKKGKEKEGEKYTDYFDYSETAKTIPSHRYLAIKRGEDEGFLKVSIDVETDYAIDILERVYLQGLPEPKIQVGLAIEDSLKRLLLPSLEKEYDNKLKEKADLAAIQIFTGNLRQLLLSAPLGQKRVLSIDPGIRTGCKTVVLNEMGDLLADLILFPQTKQQESAAILRSLLEKHKIEAIAIGNGTASRETEQFIKSTLASLPEFKNVMVVVVSEQGASIYSASDIAREEFPNKDLTVRGAVSIGRRLMDPLAELVKLDPKSIGVGQYQHDVDQKQLKESLDVVVESCVNLVGVELNTASKSLLSYVSGIGPSIAQNIIEYRQKNGKFKARKELKLVPRLGDKAFEQAAGFLRIHGAENPLDNSAVHPESYHIVERMAKNLNTNLKKLVADENLQQSIDPKAYVSPEIGLLTLNDILKELKKPGRDPREQLESFEFGNVSDIKDLTTNMVLPGIVTNITAFGCFVDIGVHQDGLVHLSNMANRFIKDPNEVVKVHQKVSVKVIEVDIQRKRIALSMKDA